MALKGVKTIFEKIQIFMQSYSDYRLEVYKNAYPEYTADPRKVEPELRGEFQYFLREVEELSQQAEESEGEALTPRTIEALALVKPILSAWNGITKKVKAKCVVEDEDAHPNMLFKLEV